LKEVPDSPVPPVRVSREITFKLPHEVGEIAVRRGNDGMEVRAHLHGNQGFDVVAGGRFNEQPRESFPIAVVFEDSRFAISAVHDVKRPAWNVAVLPSSHVACAFKPSADGR
jgi:hypothetical protein